MSDIPYEERTADELKALQQTFKTSAFRNYVAPPAPGYDVHGLWSCFGTQHRTGYATHAMALHWMLSKSLGIKTQLIPHRSIDIDIERFPTDRNDLLFEWTKEAVGHPHALFISFPIEVAAEMEDLTANIIPYCAFEGDRVSAYAKDLASGPIFREVWVVSEFVRQAFITAGVAPERVVTMRPMLTSGFWKMGDVDEMATQKSQRPVSNDDRFVFGTLGTWQKRKGMFDLIRAYFREFKREEPVTLVIRTSPLNSSMTIRKFKTQVTEEVAAIAREFRDNDFPRSQKMPKLQFELGTDLTDQGVIDWLGTLDCYVNPSYGEGLGIPHVWAKAQGVPMVTSDYGAVGQMMFEIADAVGDLSDFVFPSIDTPVDPEMLKLGLMFERATRWGTYDVANLSTSMRLATQRGRRVETAHAHYVRNAFGPDALGPLRTALRRLLPEKAQEWL